MKELYKKDKGVNKLANYINDTYFVEPEMIFDGDFDSVVFRHALTKKWFGLVMKITADKLGLNSKDFVYVLNVKGDPFLIDSLIDGVHFFKAYHMNKTHWITILLKDGTSEETVKMLIDMSYFMTK